MNLTIYAEYYCADYNNYSGCAYEIKPNSTWYKSEPNIPANDVTVPMVAGIDVIIDGEIHILDISRIGTLNGTSAMNHPKPDVNKDGIINYLDFNIVVGFFSRSVWKILL